MEQRPLPVVTDSSCGTGPGTVPVFNCVVILRRDESTGRISGRVANLDGIAAEGHSERDVLLSITKQFKAAVRELTADGKPIPWLDPPQRAAAGEFERFVPVHL